MDESALVLLSIPGLRRSQLPLLESFKRLGDLQTSQLLGAFPCVTWPSQATMLTGKLPREHGVVANGFYWRDRHEVEMWTAPNRVIERPQLWELLKAAQPQSRSMAWFPMLSKESQADIVCMPAPIHNPDGSESLWCYSKPRELYGELLDAFGHFPLQHFWGPLAGIQSTQWIVNSAVFAADRYRPHFLYIYLPHLDYAAQMHGPFSPQAEQSVRELDAALATLIDGLSSVYASPPLKWLLASEYVISPVDHVVFPNRVLREAGLLSVCDAPDGEHLDFHQSDAWALVDHQFSHVFVRDRNPQVIARVRQLFQRLPGIELVLGPDERGEWGIDHDRSGDVILLSRSGSWQAYYWWLDDGRAPTFARTVDIHRKPGYDPVELFFDPATRSIPLDASLVKGSHGLVEEHGAGEAIVVASGLRQVLADVVQDVDVCRLLLNEFSAAE